MSQVLSVLSTVFWGAVVLSVLVFIHEAGHYLAARAAGARVTEFMLGLPCRLRLSFKSRRVGTEIGVTPILLGGYNRICGMEPEGEVPPELMARALAVVQREGTVACEDVASELGVGLDEAVAALASLADWASIEPFFDPALGEKPNQKEWPRAFRTVRRDANLLTEFDRGHDFALPGAAAAGEARVPDCGADEFLAAERARTYAGKGFWGRLAILFAGPLVNIAFAFLTVTLAFSLVGMDVSVDSPQIGSVAEGSLAAECGLAAGDVVESVAPADGSAETEQVDSWRSLVSALAPYLESGEDFVLRVERDGAAVELPVEQGGASHQKLGINASQVRYRPSLFEAAGLAVRYGQTVASYVVDLIVPQKTMEVLGQSSSIVGISVMASEAAGSGLLDLVLLAASISMSLGFMNLLPIPPLDGGKIVIELIQAAIKRPLPLKVQNAISYVGLAFFLFVFVVVMRNDVLRYVIG